MSSRSSAYALASASGVLLALSFPKFGHPAVAWIALTPLLIALTGLMTMRRAFTLGLVTGVVYFTGTLYWITGVMARYGDMAWWVAVLINAALILYQALYVALFAVVVRRIVFKHGPAALMAAPLVWVTTELGRTYVLSGFPWVLLGYSQTSVLPIAQFASLFGVYGVSMLVASVSAALASHVASHRLHLGRGRQLAPLAVVFAMVIAVAAWGSRRAAIAEWTRTGEPIRVGLIQGNIDQNEKIDPARAAAIFQDYLRLTRQAIREGAGFVIWPESSTPFRFEDDLRSAAQIRTLAQQARVPILFGSDQFVRGASGAPTTFYNSAFLVGPDGTTGGVYRKMHLVPFGEYVPAKNLLFFAAPLVQAVSDFSAGEEAALLPVGDHLISTAICYEVVYPDLVRRFVAGGSEMLTTITNDAWFGPTSAPYQHFEQASMRAIEEGRYLVRSANTGISGIVDPYGRVIERTRIYERAAVVGEARFLKTVTVYARIGDLLAYASVLATAALLTFARRVK
ncbi:MAG: lnt [Acidobacteria bacterium]|nr:lnt [Acidobacteriota bacterium]